MGAVAQSYTFRLEIEMSLVRDSLQALCYFIELSNGSTQEGKNTSHKRAKRSSLISADDLKAARNK